jgi:hypothetical protein
MSTLRRISICLALAVLVALACAVPSLAHGPGVRAWLTTGDRASLLGGARRRSASVAGDGQSFSNALPAGAVATFALPHGS